MHVLSASLPNVHQETIRKMGLVLTNPHFSEVEEHQEMVRLYEDALRQEGISDKERSLLTSFIAESREFVGRKHATPFRRKNYLT